MSSFLTAAALHEFYAARPQDATATCGLALTALNEFTQGKSMLWVRHAVTEAETGAAYACGLAELGIDPAGLILLRVRNDLAALQAALEGARTVGLGAVLVEIWGKSRVYDLTASRRLAMAAKTSGVTVLIARAAAPPEASAAETRWLVSAALSRQLDARAPGPPAFKIALLRARSGQEGKSCQLEWNRDERRFTIVDPDAGKDGAFRPGDAGLPAISGIMAAIPAHRPVHSPLRKAG